MPRKQKKYHYIYKTTCNVTKKFYVGMHSTDDLEDEYLGSGKRLIYSINKYGRDKHKREILEFLLNRRLLKEREENIVNEDFINDVLCMNLMVGGQGGFISKEQQLRRTQASNRSQKLRCETDPIYKEYRHQIRSKAMKKRHKTGEFLNRIPTFENKKHSKESKRKIGLTNSIKQKGELNSQFGTCWITNGKESKKINKENEIPYGWRLGRIKNFD